ncbi:extracellular solute-binding protein [Cohnella fermenti]|uniref:Extracellular solute-binding protein n=1 Tax=Cohnella fermenti TaxID=2565925 RepID=A0A4S4BQM6_9BACL|nr:extracellular solute-binding protein [Cohnella fermenti]THF76722.1 extracellular solute-binding protein [Cohnella fermenti]
MFRTSIRKSLPPLLAAGLLAGLLAGCSGNGNNENSSPAPSGTSPGSSSPAATSTPKEIEEVSVLVYDRGNMPSSEGSLEDNWFTKELNKRTEEQLGIHVKFVPVPNAQREQKLAALLAAGDAPDISYTYDQAMLKNYSKNGGLADIAPLLDEFGPDIKTNVGEDRLEASKIDGQLTRVFANEPLPADTTWIRTDWLDKLGMSMPTNVDEFYNYLKAVKEKDPGNVGENLVPFMIPAQGDTPFQRIENIILQGFLQEPPTTERIGSEPFQLWPETKETFRFLNKLYNEGLMGQLILDKDQSQYKQKLVRGEIGATPNFPHYMYATGYGDLLTTMQKNVPGSNFAGSFPWKSTAGAEPIYELFLNSLDNSMTFFIPKATKHLEAAVKLLNYMTTDDFVNLAAGGLEGTDYNVIDGLITPIDQEKFKERVGWLAGNYNLPVKPYATDAEKYKRYIASQFSKQAGEDFVKNTVYGEPARKYSLPVINVDRPVTLKNKTNLDTVWNNAMPKIIMAKTAEFDSTYDKMLASWRSEGGDAMAAEWAATYKEQYGG